LVGTQGSTQWLHFTRVALKRASMNRDPRGNGDGRNTAATADFQRWWKWRLRLYRGNANECAAVLPRERFRFQRL